MRFGWPSWDPRAIWTDIASFARNFCRSGQASYSGSRAKYEAAGDGARDAGSLTRRQDTWCFKTAHKRSTSSEVIGRQCMQGRSQGGGSLLKLWLQCRKRESNRDSNMATNRSQPVCTALFTRHQFSERRLICTRPRTMYSTLHSATITTGKRTITWLHPIAAPPQ
jgi:hypothetical protein